jgi:hypothetical protein
MSVTGIGRVTNSPVNSLSKDVILRAQSTCLAIFIFLLSMNSYRLAFGLIPVSNSVDFSNQRLKLDKTLCIFYVHLNALFLITIGRDIP